MKIARSQILISAVCLVWFLAAGCEPGGKVAYNQTFTRAALSREQRKNLTEADIRQLAEKGDQEYANDEYSAAMVYYREVLLAQPNNVNVLVSYGACLGNLEAYDNAIAVFNVALEKEPGNQIAKENIAICQQQIAQQTEQQRQLRIQQERQQQENLNNLMASVGALSAQVQQMRQQQNKSGGGNNDSASQGGGNRMQGGGGGSSDSVGTGTIVIENVSGINITDIRICENSFAGAVLATRASSVANGLSVTFSNIKSGRVFVRVSIGYAGSKTWDKREKSVDLGNGKTVTLIRSARGLELKR
jgi:hypothetical protein